MSEKKRKRRKNVELELISELMKNCRRSDRELARALKTSQPTVTRVRSRLEKEGILKEYSAIPDFRKLGFQLVSFILIKIKKTLNPEEVAEARRISTKDMMGKAPDEIVLFNRGMGSGYDGVLVAYHNSYSDYTRLVARMKEYPFVDTSATLSFIVDLNDKTQYRYFTLTTLAKHLLTMPKKAEKDE